MAALQRAVTETCNFASRSYTIAPYIIIKS